MLISIIDLLEDEKENILEYWIKQHKVQVFLNKYKMKNKFINLYSGAILEYYYKVIKKEAKIGNCPAIKNMLSDFASNEIPPHDLHNLCTNFKNSLIYITYELGINSQIVFNEVSSIVDNNIEGVMKTYVHLINNKNIKISDLEIAIKNNEIAMSLSLGEMGELRSKETGEHVKRVSLYSELLSNLIGLSSKETELIKNASPMHDLGKLGIPDYILNKPGKLTDEEFKIMKQHSFLGFDVLNNSTIELMKYASIIALEHHEKWDGSGYPSGKKECEIHIAGRIVAIADVFDALGETRVYKEDWDDKKIFNFFSENKGIHFDPQLTELFLNSFDKFILIRNNNLDKK